MTGQSAIYGFSYDQVLIGGLGIGWFGFDIPSTGAGGTFVVAAGYLGLGYSVGFSGGQVATFGDLIGRGLRYDLAVIAGSFTTYFCESGKWVGSAVPRNRAGQLDWIVKDLPTCNF